MVLSQLFIAPPYFLAWHLKKLVRKSMQMDFFIGETMDYDVMESVIRAFPHARIVAKNKAVQGELAAKGVESVLWPTFPDVVVMARHATYKFPLSNIVKIGISHGVYDFKRMIAAKKYNVFDAYFLTSKKQLKKSEKHGITVGKFIGYPKLDAYISEEVDLEPYFEKLRTSGAYHPSKKTVMFNATWDGSGMSAVHLWIDHIHLLTDRYNVMATLHPLSSQALKDQLRTIPGIYVLVDSNSLPYQKIADVLVSDTSSLIGEFCAFDKPIITFKVHSGKRLAKEITKLLRKISHQVDSFDELEEVLPQVLETDDKAKQRRKAIKKFFTTLDGKATERAVQEIHRLLAEKGLA
jgi:CDP-glycerol glycerophosphotransferase (TagB/SpsB family)